MPLTPEAQRRNREAHDILYTNGLIDYSEKLYQKASEFVLDMDEKFQRFGPDAYVSEAQLKWLQKLETEYCK